LASVALAEISLPVFTQRGIQRDVLLSVRLKVGPTGDEGVRFGGVAGGVPGVAHDASLSWDSRVGRVPAGRTGVDRPSGAGYDRIRLRCPCPPGSRPPCATSLFLARARGFCVPGCQPPGWRRPLDRCCTDRFLICEE